jgi:2,4-dienoyl-CoA reductase-like NADH-dependent reductase (Old Yellow Enzyme family)/thioredoxin reductase
MYKKLFEPGKIGNVKIKNRTVMTAMGVGVAEPTGMPGERWATYFEERAKGEVGLIITEVTRVNNNNGVATPGQLSVATDAVIKPLSKAVDRIHKHGTKIFVQLHHPGRQSMAAIPAMWPFGMAASKVFPPFWKVAFAMGSKMNMDLDALDTPLMIKAQSFLPGLYAPSDVPCGLGVSFVKNQPTHEMTKKQIHKLQEQFIDGAVRCKKAGVDGVELHAAHGYLIQQFLSPYTNRRKDEYGGSLENRMRFISEIIEGIKDKCGKDYPVIVRLTVNEFYDALDMPDEGIKLEEGIEMAKRLEKLGVDAIDVSCASYETLNHLIETMSFEQGWRAPFVKAIKDAVKIPVIGVGVIREPAFAEKLLKEGTQDFIGLGRPLIADPYWVKKAKEGKDDEIQRCICCVTCFESLETNALSGQPCECSMNPRACREFLYEDIKKGKKSKTIVVVGAGPAGLTAARECAKRGYKTVLLEKAATTGGQLNLAKMPPHKDKMNWAIEDLTKQAELAGVKIKCGVDVTEAELAKYKPYGVIIATGGVSAKPPIPGSDKPNVCTTTDILNGTVSVKDKNVAVIGSGMTGLETSSLLVECGNKLTIVEMADKIAPGLWCQHYFDVVPGLEKAGTKFITGSKLVEITDGAVVLEDKKGKRCTVDADAVVLSLGVKPVNNLEEAARKVAKKVVVVGDAKKPGKIYTGTKEAFKAAITI